ncbi:MAG: AI-2E family transporter, partial [Proteobacteria bacterium]|nr:AI-2E family transporter [Pseudomonadota bacterium]
MKKGLYIWAGVIALLLFVYATKAILLPFLVGLAVAYLLDPVADKFELIKLP